MKFIINFLFYQSSQEKYEKEIQKKEKQVFILEKIFNMKEKIDIYIFKGYISKPDIHNIENLKKYEKELKNFYQWRKNERNFF